MLHFEHQIWSKVENMRFFVGKKAQVPMPTIVYHAKSPKQTIWANLSCFMRILLCSLAATILPYFYPFVNEKHLLPSS